MGAFLCLSPTYPTEQKDHKYLEVLVKQLQEIQGMAEKLNSSGWRTEYTGEPDGTVVCLPPKELEEAEDVRNLAKEAGVETGDYGFVEYDDDIDDIEVSEQMCGGDVHIDDADEVEFPSDCCEGCEDDDYQDDNLMAKSIAEAVTGKKIEVVDIIEDYRVVFHLDDGSKLMYDEDDFKFTLLEV